MAEQQSKETTDAGQRSGAAAPRRVSPLSSFRLIVGHGRQAWPALFAAMVLTIVSVACELVPVWVIWQLTALVIAGPVDLATWLSYAGMALAALALGHLVMAGAIMLAHLAAYDVIHALRLAILRKIERVPLGWFSGRASGEIKKLVIDEPEKLEAIAAHALPEGTGALLNWLAISVWLFAVDWRMALASIVLTPLSFTLMVLAMRRSAVRLPEYQHASARMNGAIVEYLSGMAIIKIFNRTGESFAGTAGTVHDHTRVETEMGRAYIPFGGTFYALVLANITVILPVGMFLVSAGSLSVANLVLFVIIGAGYSQPLLRLFNLFHHLAHISMASTMIATVLDTPDQADSGRHMALVNHDVRFENVGFGYGKGDVLHGVCMHARTGTTTALVGPSGSGKSTMAMLVGRFHDVDTGRITIGGVDIRALALDQLMAQMAFVQQETFLFSDTIRANILLGRSDAGPAEIEAAARAACAHDFIMALPQGYETRLGAGGTALSGGERQRIAIARAILKDAPIIVLDEATAFADPDNEAMIQQAIGALAKGKTLIVIAHRLHTITQADQIVVLEHGHVVQAGRHEHLAVADGLYARLWADYRHADALPLQAGEVMP